MGRIMSRLQDALIDLSLSPSRILMLGLDAAGKTTILYKLKLDTDVHYTLPTIGFNVETVSVCKGVTFTVWDVGGQEKLRRLWTLYYKGSHGILFVVDSSDRDRLPAAKKELMAMCKSPELKRVPVVIVANKQDRPDALTISELREALCLGDITDRFCHVYGTCATKGQGLIEVMTSLAGVVKQYKRKQRSLRRRTSIG